MVTTLPALAQGALSFCYTCGDLLLCDSCVVDWCGGAGLVWTAVQQAKYHPTDAQSLPRVRVFIVGRIRCTSVLTSWLRGVASSVTSGQVLLDSPRLSREWVPGRGERACHMPPPPPPFSAPPFFSSLAPPLFVCAVHLLPWYPDREGGPQLLTKHVEDE